MLQSCITCPYLCIRKHYKNYNGNENGCETKREVKRTNVS